METKDKEKQATVVGTLKITVKTMMLENIYLLLNL